MFQCIISYERVANWIKVESTTMVSLGSRRNITRKKYGFEMTKYMKRAES